MIFVAFLFPLTLYVLVLALINGRPRPVVVSGVWDFAGVLFAVSGFLLAGGPAALTVLDERWRMFWLALRGDLPGAGDAGWLLSVTLLVGYFFVVLTGSVLLLLGRRRTTSVYNVEREALEEALHRVLEGQGLTWVREGRTLWIRPAPGGGGPLAVEVDAFPLMRHVLLRWRQGDGPQRQQVEDGLREALREVQTPDNPAASWFLWTGASLFLVMFGIVILLIALTLFTRPH